MGKRRLVSYPSMCLVSPCACSDTLHLSVSKNLRFHFYFFFFIRTIVRHVEVEHPVSTLQHTRLAAAQCSAADWARCSHMYVWNSQPCGSAYSKAAVSAVQCVLAGPSWQPLWGFPQHIAMAYVHINWRREWRKARAPCCFLLFACFSERKA